MLTFTSFLIVVFSGMFGRTEGTMSSHVLDTASGSPACGVRISLELLGEAEEGWTLQDTRITDTDGRVSRFIPDGNLYNGTYRLQFATKEYFERQNQSTFFPYVEVVVEISDSSSHYHIPLLLSPYSYTTYRGS